MFDGLMLTLPTVLGACGTSDNISVSAIWSTIHGISELTAATGANLRCTDIRNGRGLCCKRYGARCGVGFPDRWMAPVAGGLNLALMYSNPPGVNSPAAAVRAEFNKIGVALQGELAGKPAQTAVPSRPAAAAVASSAPDRKLCLAGACLGMTPAEVATLNLLPAGMMQFRLGGKNDGGYGLDRAGKRISFSDMGDFDSKSMKQFAATVDTICRFNFASAKMKASDGQPIHLVFRPVIRSGKGVVVLTSIDRKLPPNTSETELKRFADAAKEQFGEAFSAESRAIVTRPTAEMHYDVGSGRSLKLSLPIENVHARLMEQPGCSEKPSLD